MKILKLTGTINVLTGLHIGGGDDVMKIGGIDNPVIRDANTNKPYIPGSSLKGKIRSLLEWSYGLVNLDAEGKDDKEKDKNRGKPFGSDRLKLNKNNPVLTDEREQNARNLIYLFGDSNSDPKKAPEDFKAGITRISFGDCKITKECQEKADNKKLHLTESKYENVIDRKTGTASNPRQSERVPAGVIFDLDIRVKILDGDDKEAFIKMIEKGLELLNDDALGGSGSRGYGRVKLEWKKEEQK